MTQVLKKAGGLNRLDCFSAGVLAGFSTREVTRDLFPRFFEVLHLPFASAARVKQVHGDQVLLVEKDFPAKPKYQADGMVTAQADIPLVILTADCLPAFFWDSEHRACGLIHAGWRGLKNGILANAVHKMKACFESKPGSLQVAFGPAIRGCCYEVGEEFREFFPQFYLDPGAAGKLKGRMDLVGAASDQLLSEGVSLRQIFDSGICTVCQNHRFFSARKEKTEERILSFIQIR